MEGVNDPPDLRGIIPRAFAQIFEMIAARGGENTEFLVRASYLEIYNEDVRDLLSKNAQNKLDLKETPESGVYVKDLTSCAHPPRLRRLTPHACLIAPSSRCADTW